MKYIKLNTNESPFPPSSSVKKAVTDESDKLMLYCDPDSTELIGKIATLYQILPEEVIVTNGSDEVLDLAFQAFCDNENSIAFADITYGFYSVFAEKNGLPYEIIPLKDDFSIDINDYIDIEKNIVIANPNAPTGMYVSVENIEKIVKSNPDHVVIIDEAYIDFGGESAYKLIKKYDNVLITQTFSKSRSMAGARLGIGIGSKEIIKDINTIRCSTNPYNVNRMTQAAGCAAIDDNTYYMENCKKIMENREWTKKELERLGFSVTDSKTNFLFAKNNKIGGKELYLKLKENGILVRHFEKERISDYNRITIGTKEQMETFISKVEKILKEKNI
jgi:histidinol-phosphate aminotransferase